MWLVPRAFRLLHIINWHDIMIIFYTFPNDESTILLHVREPDPDVNIISCHGKSFKKYLILNMFYLHKKHIGKCTIGARSIFYSVDFNIQHVLPTTLPADWKDCCLFLVHNVHMYIWPIINCTMTEGKTESRRYNQTKPTCRSSSSW